MFELQDLYQEIILDHSKRPRNFRCPDAANRQADGHNPLCGDHVTVYLEVEDGVVADVAFEGSGCAISTASASVMTELVKGKSEAEARAMFARFHDLVTGEEEEMDELDKMSAFAGVARFPMRVKCATLCWHTLAAALDGAGDVTTE
jgi:nitrogen fixation NifU-like protein